MRDTITKSLVVIGLLQAGVILAAGQRCDVDVNATIADTDTAVIGATATAARKGTRRTRIASFRSGRPYFANLAEGEYTITVKKPGFKTTIDNLSLSCAEAENGVVTANVSMWKGRSAMTVDLTKPVRHDRFTVLGVASGDQTTEVDVADDASVKHPPVPPPPIETRPSTTLSGGILNGKATSLPKPAYPPAARAVRASGAVSVQVLIDESGDVVSAAAVSGHPLLRAAAVSAARQAKFTPTKLHGEPVRVSGVIVYNFVP